MSEYRRIPCVIQRGGTSKGVYIHEKDLPADEKMRTQVILAIFGSPDVRQIDGLGGADPLTSKCAIIGPSDRPDADVNYTMAQVGITDALIDFKGNCGNISSGVGPFAIDEGLVEAHEPGNGREDLQHEHEEDPEGICEDPWGKVGIHRGPRESTASRGRAAKSFSTTPQRGVP